MRNQPLGLVRSKVKAETHKTLDTTNTADDLRINQLIETVQQDLADSFSWGFLEQRWDAYVNPGTRFAVFPTTLSPQGGAASPTASIDFNRPYKVQTKWNNIWIPVVYGISEQNEFNYLDSDRGQVLDPVQRWQMSDTGQFEVWPLPATQAQIRFKQNRALTSLQTGSTIPPTWNDSATLDLDDLLVVYNVALLFQADQDQPLLAQRMVQRASARLKILLGDNPVREETYTIGRGQPFGRKSIKLVPLVMVGGGQPGH
jgi:hypothetical protein